MRKLGLLIFVLFAIETWGVIGAWQTQKLTKTCEVQAGPLCFWWDENALGKLLGEQKSDELEDALKKAKKVWEKDFVEKTVKEKGKSGVDKAVDDVKKGIEDGVDKAKEQVQKAVEDLKK